MADDGGMGGENGFWAENEKCNCAEQSADNVGGTIGVGDTDGAAASSNVFINSRTRGRSG